MKKILSGVLASFILVSTAVSAFADSKSLYSFIKFNAVNENRFEVEYNSDGRIDNICAKNSEEFCKSATTAQFDAVRIANDFINDNAALFGINKSCDLKVESIERTEAVSHIYFVHQLKGKNIIGSEISVHVNNAGQVILVNNSIVPIGEKAVEDVAVSETAVTGNMAVDIAKKHINLSDEREPAKFSEVVTLKDGKPVNAYKVEIPAKEPFGDFVCIVSAADGSVLDSLNIMKHSKTGSRTRSGSVYVNNPIRGEVTNEPLENFSVNPSGVSGKWASIRNEDHGSALPGSDGNYIFTPENTHFDEVNAYYHVNKIHDYFSKFKFTGLDRAMRVTVHYGNSFDNAFFSPMSGGIGIGDGNKLNDLAKEECVIYHEYVHATTHAIVTLPYTGESGALDEAYADYFSCSITDDPEIGEWAMAKSNQPYFRTLKNGNRYPQHIYNEVHYDSCIFSGALWDLRRELGAATTDKLTHISRFYLRGYSSARFTSGLKALLSADKEYFKGENAGTIKSIFAARGIKLAAKAAADVTNLKQSLKYDAMNGDREAQSLLLKVENEFPETEEQQNK